MKPQQVLTKFALARLGPGELAANPFGRKFAFSLHGKACPRQLTSDGYIARRAHPNITRQVGYLLFPFAWIFSLASFSAVARASVAGTFTSGSTPVPSQFVFATGSSDFANGTPIMK
jgi:hypothetical protein